MQPIRFLAFRLELSMSRSLRQAFRVHLTFILVSLSHLPILQVSVGRSRGNACEPADPTCLCNRIYNGARHTDSLYLTHNLHHVALAPTRWLARILRLLHFCYHHLKGFGDISVQPRTSLSKAAVKLFGQLTAIVGRDVPLIGSQIAFVANNDQGYPFGALACSQPSV
jgi:hypothetical protein